MDKKEAVTLVGKYVQSLKKTKFSFTKAYLFGSYARGNSHEDSDIDVALIMKNVEDRFFMEVELMKLRRNFDLRIEPHIIDEADISWHPLAKCMV